VAQRLGESGMRLLIADIDEAALADAASAAFVPDHVWQFGEDTRGIRDFVGDLDYFGDRHTHPDGIASMGTIDATLRRIAYRVRPPSGDCRGRADRVVGARS
jgi:hypothetical protein